MALDVNIFDDPDGTFELEVRGETLEFAYDAPDDIGRLEAQRKAEALHQAVQGQQDEDDSEVELSENDFRPVVAFVREAIRSCEGELESDGEPVEWAKLAEGTQRTILRSDIEGLVSAYFTIVGDPGLTEDEKKS